MTDREIEEKIRTAAEHAAPDKLSVILSLCTPYNNNIGSSVYESRTGTARIILDVNPSISVELDDDERVSRVVPLNKDGEGILDGLLLDGTTLDEAMDAIVEAMVARGYLSDIQNSILVSVEDNDPEKQDMLQDKVSRIIEEVMTENLGSTGEGASVISQTLSEDDELRELADTYGISVGKAALIRKMTGKEGNGMDNNVKFEDLAPMSVNDIALLADDGKIEDKTVKRLGHASEKAYIGHKGALKAALNYAGIPMRKVYKQKIKLSCKKGLMIYKVKLKTTAGKFKYYLDARTGEMVRCKKNGKGKYGKYGKYGKKYKKYNAGYFAAGTPAGINEVNNNMAVREETNNYNENWANVQIPEGAIGEQAAKESALAHAGIKESDVLYITCHPEIDHGHVEHYDVKFVAGGMKYKYAIGLYDGAVLGRAVKDKVHKTGYVYEGNYHEHAAPAMKNASTASPVQAQTVSQSPQPAAQPANGPQEGYDDITGDMLSEDDALSIAMNKAGLEVKDMYRWKVKLRTKHGRTVYRFKFKVPGYEYEIDVDAFTGAVTKAHKEYDM